MTRIGVSLLSLALAVVAALDARGIVDAPDFVGAMAAGGGLAMACNGLSGALANGFRGCDPDPGAREWILADRIDSSRLAKGSQVDVRLAHIPARDTLGRFAHVKGIRFAARGLFETAADNDAADAYLLRSLYSNLHLEDSSGHVYFDGIDGRVILDDQYFRHYAMQEWPYLHGGADAGDDLGPVPTVDYGIADADPQPGPKTVNLSLYIPLAANADYMNPVEGAIPLASIQAAGLGALRFNVAQNIATAPTGVTWTSFLSPDPSSSSVAMEVWLDVVYLDAVVVDAPWAIESYQLSESSGMLRHPERITEYAWLRYLAEDATGGQQAVNSLSGFNISAAGFAKVSGYTLWQMYQRQSEYARTVPDSAISEGSTVKCLPEANEGIRALMFIPMRQRASATAGAVTYNIATDPLDFLRFTHRTVKCQSQARIDAVVAATKCDPCRLESVTGGKPTEAYAPVVVYDAKKGV